MTGAPRYALWYRSDPYLATDGIVQFAPFFFAEATPLPSSPGVGFTNDYDITSDIDTTREAKEVGHLVIPTGNIMVAADSRLYVSGIGSTTQASELWVSADQDPFSFRQVPVIDDFGNQDPASPTYRTFDGETVKGLLKLHGQILSVDSILAWTDRGLYRLGGFDSTTLLQASRLSEKGTYRRQSISAYDGTVWYLDTEGQARTTNGGLASEPRSLRKVDNLLSNGTITGAWGVAADFAYRLFFQLSGDSAIYTCLTWQEATGEWVIDRYPFAIAGAIVHDFSPRRTIYAATDTGLLYQLEVPGQTTDAGTAIPIRVDSPELVPFTWMSAAFGQVSVRTDGTVNTTLTTTRTCPLDGSTTVATIDLTTSNLTTPSAWRSDLGSLGEIPETPSAPSCVLSITGNMPSAKRIRGIEMKISPRNTEPDVP